MLKTNPTTPLAELRPVPDNPLPYLSRLRAARDSDAGPEILRDAGGAVTRVVLGPKWLMPEMVFVSSPTGARDLLHQRDSNADRSSLPMIVELRRLLGGNLINLPHVQWLPRRRALQPLFSKQRVTDMTDPIIAAATEVSRNWADGGEVDLAQETRTMTVRALSRSFLGVDLAEEAESIGASMHHAFNWIAARALTPARLPMWVPTPAQRRARRGAEVLHRHAAAVIKACREDPTLQAPAVRALMNARDPDTGTTLSDNDICDELVMFMFGGHDTISTTLTYTLWQLGHHPDIQKRVAEESRALGDRPLTADDRPHLAYTTQVIHETLRLCPPVPVLSRMVHRDIDVDGYRVTAGTFALVSLNALHRDAEAWEEPLVFDPDRFSSERFASIDRWQYLPFSAGPHSCMGDHFAMLEAILALATIARDVEITCETTDFPTKTALLKTPAGAVPARVRPRN